ncbi:hypothetical protein U1Q18_036455, partial [Sarracenia purpurea var. burkii]
LWRGLAAGGCAILFCSTVRMLVSSLGPVLFRYRRPLQELMSLVVGGSVLGCFGLWQQSGLGRADSLMHCYFGHPCSLGGTKLGLASSFLKWSGFDVRLLLVLVSFGCY